MLYDFQKDAVLSAIQKIHKYNGCIIADSVSLGKTFEALTVIKYFELRQDNVLVLTPANFYKLLEMMTIVGSRRHMTSCCGTDKVGTFLEKLKPDTYTPHIDTKRTLLNFKETNLKSEELILAVDMPMSYILPKYKQYYRDKYKTTLGGKDIFFHEDREFLIAKLHRFNLFKQLNSSVFAFAETLRT